MKKIVVIFAAMAAVLSSCQKNELESVSANEIKDIVLNISVSNPGADDTKALVKTDWVEGDQIKIWFDDHTGDTPDLVIKYDGSDWKGTPASTPKSEGNIKAVYNNFVIVASTDGYTYKDNTLSFHIENWKFLTEIQVVVKGLDYYVNEPYTLSCDKFTPLDKTGFKVTEAGIESVVKTKGNPAVGQANADGVAFVFATAEYSSADAKFKFTLKNLVNEDFGAWGYTATTNKISGTTGSMTAIKALTIAISKFTAAALDGFVDLGVVVNSKPLYWAEKNLGATNPQDYGKYFSWGDVTGQTPSGSAFSPGFSWSNAPFNGKGLSFFNESYFNNVKNTVCPGGVLAQTYDAAYQTNNAWRMPTKEDFKELAKQCFLEWTENYNSTGVKGMIVWKAKNGDAGWFKPSTSGKGLKIEDDGSGYNFAEDHTFSNTYAIGTDPCVFFPAAGCGDGTGLGLPGEYGYYWSSSLYGNMFGAYRLLFNKANVGPQYYGYRCDGLSVRPVSDIDANFPKAVRPQ